MNDVTIFTQALPAHLQAKATLAAQMNAAAATGTTSGASVNKLSIKGSKFRLVVGGEEIKVLNTNDLDLVIVRANDHITKTYFAKPWKPGQEPESPDCSSDDGVTPRADSKDVQCTNCAGCPHNEWGSYINPQTGAKSKKCSDSKRIAVIPPSQLLKDGDLFQLQIPAASLKEFGALMNSLSTIQPPVPYNAVVVTVSFDTDQTYPKLLFKPKRYLTAEEYAAVEARYDDDEAKTVAGIPALIATDRQPAPAAKAEPAKPAAKAEPAPQPAAEDDEWGDAPAKPAAEAKPARKPRAKAAAAEPATIDGNTGKVESTPAAAASDPDLDEVFGEGWD